MKIVIDKPAVLKIVDPTPNELDLIRTFLTYHDRSVDFQIHKLKNNRWFQSKDPEGWSNKLAELKQQQKACILSETKGDYETYSGLAEDLSAHLGGVTIEKNISYPDLKGIAWAKVPPPARPYQISAKETLLTAKHGAIEYGTGLGKSRVAMDICHDIGLQSVIMAPSCSIANQLFDDFSKYFGSRYVGMYGDGKKQLGKLFTIGIAASLTRIEPETDAWSFFNKSNVFICDESHMIAAATLEKVAMGLMGPAQYRFSFSGTQMRGDGAELVLKGLIGPIVQRMSVQEGVDQGWLAKPQFKIIKVKTGSSYYSDDVQRMTRIHLLQNKEVLDRACDLANKSVSLLGHQVVILIDEISQFPLILARLSHSVGFAHGQSNSPEVKKTLSKQYQQSDPTKLVAQFNNREFPILVGTSCIGTGTDIRPVETCIYLMGGASEIQVTQAVGRCTRRCDKPDGTQKIACNFIDFAPVLNTKEYQDDTESGSMSPIFRHALTRSKIYKGIYPSLSWI